MAMTVLGSLHLVDHSHDYPDDFTPVPLQEKRLIVIHHTASGGSLSLATLYAEHKQYGGIGYNALVYPDGQIVYCGDWNTSRAGAAQLPHLNWAGYHIALVGDFSISVPPSDQVNSARLLLSELQWARGLRLPIVPHCLFNTDDASPLSKWNTSCPGVTWPLWYGRLLQ